MNQYYKMLLGFLIIGIIIYLIIQYRTDYYKNSLRTDILYFQERNENDPKLEDRNCDLLECS